MVVVVGCRVTVAAAGGCLALLNHPTPPPHAEEPAERGTERVNEGGVEGWRGGGRRMRDGGWRCCGM